MLKLITRIWNDEKGEGMMEYGMIIALLALLLIGILIAVNGGVNTIYGNVTESVKSTGN